MFWPLMKEIITKEHKKVLTDFITNNSRLTNGPRVEEFEKQWSEWLGVKHSLMVSSGSTANFLLLAAIKELYKIPDGAKVLVPSMTWVTNISPVFQLNMEPIFCDVDYKTFSFCEDHLRKIKEKHPAIGLIWITHLLGIAADTKTCRELWPGALIAEDVCESHGVEVDGVKAGSGDYTQGGTFSFYFGHHMSTIEGGMVSTNNFKLYNLMRAKRSHGMVREMREPQKSKYLKEYCDIHPAFLFVTDGYNFRSTELNAVLGMEQLKDLDSWIEIRKQNLDKFLEIVSSYPDIFASNIETKGNSSFALPFLCKDENTKFNLEKHLQENGVETRPLIGGNLLRQPFLSEYEADPDVNHPADFQKVEDLHETGFYIGNNHMITDEDFAKLTQLIRDFFLP